MAEEKKKRTKKGDGDGEPKEHKKNWREYMATVQEIEDFLKDHVYLRRNVVTGRTEYRNLASDEHGFPRMNGLPTLDEHGLTRTNNIRENPCQSDAERTIRGWLPIDDWELNNLWREMMKVKTVVFDHMKKVINSDAFPDFHPFRYYLEHLPPWDHRNDFILELSLSVNVKGDAEEQLRFAQYLKKWLVAMVAGWLDEREVNHVILIFIGEQGIYKTTWFNYLLPPELRTYFYTKTNSNRMTKDDLIALANYGLVCYEELDTMTPRELNQLKSVVTMPSVDERIPYDQYPTHRKHIASFCGTGNNMQFLSDATGTRRWLPFEVQSIMSPRDYPFNYEGIYAQAYALYREGFPYWFSPEEIRLQSQHNAQFETPRLEHELASLYFRQPVGVETGVFMSVARAMQLVSANISQKLSPVYLGRALSDLGFRRVKVNGVRGYIVVCRSDKEIQSIQAMMAYGADPVDSGQ